MSNSFLPEITIVDHDAPKAMPQSQHASINGFLERLGSVASETNTDRLIEDVVSATCGQVGFGPMMSVLERLA